MKGLVCIASVAMALAILFLSTFPCLAIELKYIENFTTTHFKDALNATAFTQTGQKKLSQAEIFELIATLPGNFKSQLEFRRTLAGLAKTGHPEAIDAICCCITDQKYDGWKAKEAGLVLRGYSLERATVERAVGNLQAAIDKGELSPAGMNIAKETLVSMESKLNSGKTTGNEFMNSPATPAFLKKQTPEECINILNSPAETKQAQEKQAIAVVSLFGSLRPGSNRSYTELDYLAKSRTSTLKKDVGYKKDVRTVFDEIFKASLSEKNALLAKEATQLFKDRINTVESMLTINNVFMRGTPREKMKALELLRDAQSLGDSLSSSVAVLFMLEGVQDKDPGVRAFAAEALVTFINKHPQAYEGELGVNWDWSELRSKVKSPPYDALKEISDTLEK
ncbi:MAG: hypothetical protein NTW97_01270 [Candidatus Krumholzibacteria bacterium]|nr:hypothetical protein [Candidatus Krumholzibacteria bacterium]